MEDDHHVGVDPGGTHIDQERHEGVSGKGHEDGHDTGLDGSTRDVVHNRTGSVDVDECPEECDDGGYRSCGELGTLEDAQEVVDRGKEHLLLFIFCLFIYL